MSVVAGGGDGEVDGGGFGAADGGGVGEADGGGVGVAVKEPSATRIGIVTGGCVVAGEADGDGAISMGKGGENDGDAV